MNKRDKAVILLTQCAKALRAKQYDHGEATLDYPIYRDDKSTILRIRLEEPWKKYDGKKVHIFVYVD